MTKITAIIPTFNEEDNIQRALNSVSFADEIIVIDSYSTDKTVKIVRENKNIKLIQRKFDDFSSQKNFAIQQAKHDWIFLLDADEEVTVELEKEVLEIVTSKTNFVAFYVYRSYFFKQAKLNFTGWQRDKVIRLFKKRNNVYKGKVHEKIKTTGEVGFLKNKLNHYSYKSYDQYRLKLQRYAKLQALELFEKGKIINLYHILLKPFIRFFIQFFIKLGFLDGRRGLVISFVHSLGVFLRYIELLKLKNNCISEAKKNTDKLIIGYDAKRTFHNTTGLGNYSRDLISILSKFYVQNTYFLYNPKPKKVKRLSLLDNMVEVLPSNKLWKRFSSIWRLRILSNRFCFDKLAIFHGLSGELPVGIPKKVKKIVTIHDLIFVRYPKLYSFFDRKIHFYKFKYACNVADKIVAISEQTKADIIQFLKVEASKIEVVYQGCHAVFKEEATTNFKSEVLKKYKIPTNFILNVGTIEERKNALLIVKAIKNINTTLVVVGKKTGYYHKIKTYIEANSLQNKVIFLEGVTLRELAALYQKAEVFVYPSIFEGFGIPIIEALYSKTPVITSKGGVFPEAGGVNSVYINPNSVNELRDAIEVLLSSEEKRKQIAENGFEFVQKFNDEVIAKHMMSVYNKVIEHG